MSGIMNMFVAAKTTIATAVDAFFNLTTLLLNTSSTNGAQNNTFLDSSTNNFTITRNGNTTQGTFTPFSQTGWSNYFNGSGSGPYLRFGSSSALTLGTGDFTIEFWVYFISVNDGSVSYLYDMRDGGVGSFLVQEPGNTWTYRNGADALVTTGMTSSTFAANQWYHLAICRASGVINFYVNGTKVSSNPADTSNYATTYLSIMSRSASDGGNNNTNSYTSNFRVVKGTAVYASNFTPSTTPLTAISGTSLLTCQANRFVDNSGNALTVVVDTGQPPSVQAFSPFAPTAAYDTAVVGGSGYFDGSGDYLTGPNASGGDFSTGSFTISCWVYPTTLTGGVNHGIMSYADTGGWNGWQLVARGTQKDISFEFLTGSASGGSVTGGSIALNAWNYVVVTRSGSTVNLYVNSTSVAATTTNSTAYGAAGSRVIVASDRTIGSLFFGYISNSKLVKQANAPASIPTAPDTNTTNTSFLLNYTNAGIFDSAAKNVLETVGDAQVSTTVAKWGTTSMKFDGTGDALKAPYTPNMDFGTGDFTIECWVYVTNTSPGYSQTVLARHGGTGGTIWIVQILDGGTSRINLAGSVNCAGTTVAANTWTHLAFTRSGTSLRAFNNGVLITTVTDSTSLSGTQVLTVGAQSDIAAPLIGYLDDVRITKGYARYTATFTPPAAAFPLQ
jgi:hypothetical protein